MNSIDPVVDCNLTPSCSSSAFSSGGADSCIGALSPAGCESIRNLFGVNFNVKSYTPVSPVLSYVGRSVSDDITAKSDATDSPLARTNCAVPSVDHLKSGAA